MKNKKLDLRKITVKSFVTNLQGKDSETLKAGMATDNCSQGTCVFACAGTGPDTQTACTRDYIACNNPSVPPYCPPASNPECTYPTNPTCGLATDLCPY